MANLTLRGNGFRRQMPSALAPERLWNQMDNFVENFMTHWPFQRAGDMPLETIDINLNPRVDIVEDKKAYKMSVELPGLDIKDVDIDVTDRVLTVSGEKKSELVEDKANNYHMMERNYGFFKRSFTLPSTVDEDGIQAEFKKGILNIVFPKSQKAQETQRKIPIKS